MTPTQIAFFLNRRRKTHDLAANHHSPGGARLGLGKSLVVMQVALSLSLLIIAGLFVRSLGKLYAVDAGFKKENVLLVSTDSRMIGY